MLFVTRKTFFALVLLAGIALLAAAGFVWSGIYNVGADEPHTRPVYAVMETLRERSIQVRAGKLSVPALDDPERIAQGAGNYEAMCAGCHLKPGAAETELSKGLYPVPPNLTEQVVDAAQAFWAIKHGIKASGMPAWGKSMGDDYIWNMVAFVQQLPELDAARYQALVDSSGGHSHGGGETGGRAHAGKTADHHGGAVGTDHAHAMGEDDHHAPAASGAEPEGATHVHADGKRHVHAPESAGTKAGPEPESNATAPAAGEPQPAKGAVTEEPAHDGDHQH